MTTNISQRDDDQHSTPAVSHSITSEETVISGNAPASVPAADHVVSSRRAGWDGSAKSRRSVAQITQILWFIIGLVEALLALRIILGMTAANEAAGFSQIILGVTQPLVLMFRGLFPVAAGGGFEFEPAAAVAMVVYFLLGLALARMIRIVYGEAPEAV